ncbi:DoxX family protein [Sphingomonas hankyongi]|uniref:DoxX family protein n=1 Tax=Sphingomonas hankyongi TaxID=2908209 RepID=A0ABT0S177_9SPHN|nr:DoxX family protein [Sphingomonas hankyongi]MCL6729615.1 DoxX family protein [Sphingomonas hankyongi]
MEFTWLSRWQPQLLALLRIVTALLFLQHALIKLFGFPPGGKPGLQQVGTLLWSAGVIEFVTGLLVLMGLWTRLAAFVAAGEMAVGYWMIHGQQSLYPAVNMGEAAVLFCFVFLYLAAVGPGAWSVDGARFRASMPR